MNNTNNARKPKEIQPNIVRNFLNFGLILVEKNESFSISLIYTLEAYNETKRNTNTNGLSPYPIV